MPCFCYRMEGMCGPCKTALCAEGRVPDDRVALPDPNAPLTDLERAELDGAFDPEPQEADDADGE